MIFRVKKPVPVALILLLLQSAAPAHGDWMRMEPPPDVDKVGQNLTCWLATSANMLAAAGYGHGLTMQARAQEIYNQLLVQFGAVE